MISSGVLGLVAKAEFDKAQNEGTGRHADSLQAANLADAGTVFLVAGGVVAATGAVIWLTAPREAPIAVGTNGRGIFLSGSFQ
jgi:hypothetical protein